MIDLDADFSERYREARLRSSAFIRAIKLAQGFGMDEAACKCLSDASAKISSTLDDYNHKVCKLLASEGTNVGRLDESWFVIVYLNNKNKKCVNVEPLLQQEVYLLERGPRDKPLTSQDFSNLIPSLLNEKILSAYKNQIFALANTLLLEYLNINLMEEDFTQNAIIASSHAIDRWIERVLGVKDSEQRKFKEENSGSIIESINKAFGEAEHVYKGDEESYYFNKRLILMMVVKNGIIVTLYKVDYGFIEKINRRIACEQLVHVNRLQRKFIKTQKVIGARLAVANEKLDVVIHELNELQAKMLILQQRQVVEMNKIQKYEQKLSAEKSTLQREANRIFKKCVPVLTM